MLAIESPLPLFVGRDGLPLDAGYIYFGTVDLNPITSPVTVYWDAAGTQPVAQPVRTSRGLIVRSGTPAKVYASGNFSILVKDSKGTQVVYERNSSEWQVSDYVDDLRSDLASTSDVTKGDALIGVEQEDSGAVPQTLHIWIKAARRRLDEAGFLADGLTGSAANNDAALARAMGWLRTRGGGILELPLGTGYFSADIVALLNGTTSRFFAIEGQGMEACKLLSTNGSKLKIYADTPPSRTNAFVDLVLEGFEISNTSGSNVGDGGIDVYSMQRSRISGVRGTGWNYGLRLRSSWNNTIDQRCQFDGNNVGIKVPRQGSGASLNEGFNSTDIRGISCANNVKAGISIANGNVLTIQNLLAESNPVGIYLIEAVKKATIEDVYFELGSTTKTENNRAGSLQGYVLYMGKDEDANVGDTAKPNKDLDLRHLMRDDGNGAIYLENVNGVRLPNDEAGRAYTTFGTSVKNVSSNAISGDDARSSPMVATKGRPIARNVLRDFNNNWIPNGNWSLPGLPYIVLTGAGVTAAQSTAQTMDGTSVRTLDITVPNGITTASARFDITIPTGSDFATLNNLIYSSLHAVAGSSDFATCKLEILDQGAAIASVTKSSGLSAAWFVLSCEGSVNTNVATVTSLSVKVTLTRTTGVGSAVFSIDEIVCGDTARAQIGAMKSTDIDVGLSGTVTASTLSGAWYYADVTTPFSDPAYFDVQLTARYDAAQTDTMVQYQKTGGANLRIWSNKNGAVVAYRIIPRVMLLP